MTGFSDIIKIQRFMKEVDDMGFECVDPRQASMRTMGSSYVIHDEMTHYHSLVLTPKDNRYPSYSRGVQIFVGSMEEAQKFIQGIRFAYDSDKALGLSNEIKRGIAEAKEVERIRRKEELKIRRQEQQKMWDILSDNDEEIPF